MQYIYSVFIKILLVKLLELIIIIFTDLQSMTSILIFFIIFYQKFKSKDLIDLHCSSSVPI